MSILRNNSNTKAPTFTMWFPGYTIVNWIINWILFSYARSFINGAHCALFYFQSINGGYIPDYGLQIQFFRRKLKNMGFNLSMPASVLCIDIHILTHCRPRCTTCAAVHTNCSLAKSFMCITILLLYSQRQHFELSVSIYIYFDL
jgi:hypothetical protein